MPYTYAPYLPLKDQILLMWVEHFISVANANLADTGLTAAQMTELGDLLTDFSVAVGAHQAAYTVARIKTTERDDAKAALVERTRQLGQLVRNNPSTPVVLKQELWLRAPDTPAAPVIPQQPLDFSATGSGKSYNLLKWGRGANPRGMDYVIEVKPYGSSEPWQYVGFTSKTRFKHTGQIPGVQLTYRCYAQRETLKSEPSDTANVYVNEEGGQTLELAA